MKVIYFLCWLLLAIITDLLSLIPYIGMLFSYPFAALFGIYKWYFGISFKKTGFVTGADFLAEGVFSTIPANTMDVILTFMISASEGKDLF